MTINVEFQPSDRPQFLAGGGDLGCLIAAFDWGCTPLGPISTWPPYIKTTISLILRSQVPMITLWGEDGVMIYNDAYSVFAEARHPQLLGTKVREGWAEVADFNDNVMKTCLAGGTLSYRDQPLTLNRSGRPEPVWLNLDYSPILDEDGVPAGVIAIVVETTDKVLAEHWQSSELDRQRQMFEQAPGFVAMLSGPLHIVELTNAAYMQLIGHRDIVGLAIRDALPEIEGQGYFELLDRVYESGEPFIGHALRAEIQRTPNGRKEDRFMDLIYQPVRNPGGDVVGIFVQGSDVTERVIAEETLRQNGEKFRSFADAMPNHVWTSAPDGRLQWFNPRVYEYSGTTEGELSGDGWSTMVHPDDVRDTIKSWAKARSLGEPYDTEFRLRRYDGTYRWHLARAVPIRNDAGKIIQWIGTNTDIDEQKRTAQALFESERRLQLSQEAAGIASLEVDIPTGMVYGPEKFWSLWGLSPRESVHISVLENIVIPEDRGIRSNPETRVKGTAVPNVEYRIRRPDTGELRWLSRHIDFQYDAFGKPVKMYGVMQDITERKEAQARQTMLTHELEHRIKNILAIVSAIASQTLRNTDIETAKAVFADRLQALAQAHDILNSTRWTSASIGQVVGGAIKAFPADQISVTGRPVLIDPKMALSLALAVNELGTNALKYGALSASEGKVTIDWSLDTTSTDIPQLVWRWRESGGPAVIPPRRKGFGSFLIDRVLATDFGGEVEIEYLPGGVECMLRAPLPFIKSELE